MSNEFAQFTRNTLDMLISASQFSFDNPLLLPLCCFTLLLFIGLPFAGDYIMLIFNIHKVCLILSSDQCKISKWELR